MARSLLLICTHKSNVLLLHLAQLLGLLRYGLVINQQQA
jgi:hypothetical protein